MDNPAFSPKGFRISDSVCLEVGVKTELEMGKLFKDYSNPLYQEDCIFLPQEKIEGMISAKYKTENWAREW